MATNSTELEDLKKNINDIFLLTNGIFVCLMQAGFACLEAGAVRSKNVTNIVMKNVFDVFICALFYWVIGYSVAYGDGNGFLGLTFWAGVGIPDDKMAHWFFQFIFAATAATIVSGAVAERCNFTAYIVYSGVISGFVYPIVSHWVWAEGGWLINLGYQDFAGAGAVHLLAGVCSFVAAAFLGPRIGRFAKDGQEAEDLAGHSTPLVGLGGMILIAGFLAFNGGSLGRMTEPGDGALIAKVISNTVMGGSGGAMVLLVGCRLGMLGRPSWSFAYTLNAGLAGMVSVCGGVDKLTFWTSFLSGCIAGPIFVAVRHLVIRLRIDDPLDAVAVHFGGGFWGLVSASLFSHDGIVFGASHESIMIFVYRMVGAAAIIGWSGATSCLMFGTLKLFGILRVSPEEELEGLDSSLHHEPGYPPQAWQWDVYPSKSTVPKLEYQGKLNKSQDSTVNNQNSVVSRSHRTSDFYNGAFVEAENSVL